MASKKHRPEEALAKLRQVDVLVSQDDGDKRGLSGEPPVSRAAPSAPPSTAPSR